MSKTMSVVIMLYGIITSLLSATLRVVSPERGPVVFVGVAAGLLSATIGVAALVGERRRRWIVVTTGAFSLFMLAQVVATWSNSSGVARVLTLALTLISFAMLLYSVHGERPPEFYQQRADEPTQKVR